MKLAKLKYNIYDKETINEVLLLETLDDILTYIELSENSAFDTFRTFIENNVDWNVGHFTERTGKFIRGLSQTAITIGDIKGTNAIYELAPLLNGKRKNMLRFIEEGKTVVVNKNGGYFYTYEGDENHTILETVDIFLESLVESKTNIKENTKWIVLENSPTLSDDVIESVENHDKNYSYICGLSGVSIQDFKISMNEFLNNGGDSIFIQTTGSDKMQIEELLPVIALKVKYGKIKKIHVEAIAGINKTLKFAADELEKLGCNVTIVEG